METDNIGPYSWQKGRKPGYVSYIKQFDHKFKLGDRVTGTPWGDEVFEVCDITFTIAPIYPLGILRYRLAAKNGFIVFCHEGELTAYNPIVIEPGRIYTFDLSKECKGRTPVGWRWRKETKRRVVAKYPDGRIIFVATEGPTKNLEQVVKEDDIVRSTLEVVNYS